MAGNPGQRRLNEAEPVFTTGLAAPPVHLDADAKRLWRSEGKRLLAAGVLTLGDAGTFGMYVQSMARWRLISKAVRDGGLFRTTDDGQVAPSLLWKQLREAQADYLRCATEFGLTPSARTRVQAVKLDTDKVDDEWWLEQPRRQGVN